MSKAYVKIWVKAGREEEIKETLLNHDVVMTADITAGEQDIISLIEAKSYEELLHVVLNVVRKIDGVERTTTNLVLE
jgi:DNA-binding Lrp family transcriptional regulator